MATFKIPKPGEGTRERRPSKYGGEDGRAVGGEARRAALRKGVSGKTSDPVKPNIPVKRPELPPPGGHPQHLQEAARQMGYTPKPNPFAQVARTIGAPNTPAGGETGDSDELLDSLFSVRAAVAREEVSQEERARKVKEAQKRLPILRAGVGVEACAMKGCNNPKARGIRFCTTCAAEVGVRPVEEGAPLGGLGEGGESQGGGEGPGPGAEGANMFTAPREMYTPPGVPVGSAITVTGMPQSKAAERLSKVTAYTDEATAAVAGILGMPGVVCNNCPAAESCPEFKENATCAYDEQFESLTTRDLDMAVPALEVLADIQTKRALRGYMLEQRVAGGQIDPNVTRQIEVAANAVERVSRLKAAMQPGAQQSTQSLTIIAKQQGAPQGGLVSRLLAGVTGALPQQGGGELELNAQGHAGRGGILDIPVEVLPLPDPKG